MSEANAPGIARAGLTGKEADRIIGLRDALMGWWHANRTERDTFPWRTTGDPWALLVSETMLAQTQFVRIAPAYEAFLTRFPDPSACARSSPGEVLRAWSGLGYNRRAVNLHAASREIVERHGGRVPESLDALMQLSGVGPYTARAVASAAFGARVAAVDTNVARVLARALAGRSLKATERQALADDLMWAGSPRAWNAALMDFGALICRARRPACAACPLEARGVCAWAGSPTAPDPAAVPTGRTAAFSGSDRQGRGRLVRRACSGPIAHRELAAVAGWPDDPDRARRVAADLAADGVLVEDAEGFRLP